MASTLQGVYVIGKAKNTFSITIVILKCYFNINIIFSCFKIYRLFMQNRSILIKIFYKRYYSAFKLKGLFCVVPFILEIYSYSFVKECQFPKSLLQCVEAVLKFIKYLVVRLEGNLCSCGFSISYNLKLSNRCSSFISLLIYFSIPLYLYHKPFR